MGINAEYMGSHVLSAEGKRSAATLRDIPTSTVEYKKKVNWRGVHEIDSLRLHHHNQKPPIVQLLCHYSYQQL